MQVLVDDLVISYDVIGKGEKLFFVHGWGDDSSNLKNSFKSLGNNYQLIFIDLPGFGNSERPRVPWDIDNYAKNLANFLKKIEASPKVLIGHSFGSAILIKAVAKNYITPEKLILMSASGIREKSSSKLLVSLVARGGRVLSKPLPKSTQVQLQSKLYNQIGSDYLLKEELKETFKKIVSEDMRSDAKLITISTLIIYGEQDKDTPLRFGYMFHELIETSTLEIVGDAGHFVFMDQKDRVIKLIQDFLNA